MKSVKLISLDSSTNFINLAPIHVIYINMILYSFVVILPVNVTRLPIYGSLELLFIKLSFLRNEG